MNSRQEETSMITAMLLAAALGAASFGDDVAFMKEHVDVIVLSDGQAQVALVPAYQGRVMTSTAGGGEGASYGWINRELISSGSFVPHINAFGGEDRFWLGPEGGQFALYFKKGDPFDLEHWQTPPAIDSEPFELVEQSDTSARFNRRVLLTNYSGTTFDLLVDRTIRLLDRAEVEKALGTSVGDDVQLVAYVSENVLTNKGADPWEKESGLPSIWILGMFNPSPATTIVIPYVTGDEAKLGPVVNDTYFGKVPEDRLKVADGVIYFSGDGQYRSKIGLSPKRAKEICGSYDADSQVLTLVKYNKPRKATDYVNSMWEIQDAPFAGDVVNSYNDGPPAPGAKPMGPFYELETSSPAAALKPNESIQHDSTTMHLQGSKEALDSVAQATLGVGLDAIAGAFSE
jgi:hypothetical protein